MYGSFVDVVFVFAEDFKFGFNDGVEKTIVGTGVPDGPFAERPKVLVGSALFWTVEDAGPYSSVFEV